MSRIKSGLGVTAMGALLLAAGAYDMWYGWGVILNERGWSAYIAGAVMLSSGVVTIALGRVIAQLSRHAPLREATSAASDRPGSTMPAFATGDDAQVHIRAPMEHDEHPAEVDRYNNGDEVYVMLSDGSVEVRGPRGYQRYPSLAALRADAEARKR